MAAGTEGFTDTRGSVNYYGNLVSKVLRARQLAENEREYAEKIAEKQGTSLEEAGIGRGFFLKKALQYEFGGRYIDKKKEQYNNLKTQLNTLKKSPRKSFFKLFKVKVSSYKQRKFRAKFDYLPYEDTKVKSKSSKLPRNIKNIQKATGGSKRVSREQLLSTFAELVDSLNKTAESLSNNISLTTSGIVKSSMAHAEIADQLKTRNNTLDEKLDKLIDAISNQTQVQKKNIQKAKVESAERRLETARDVAATTAFDKLNTPENEAEFKQTIEPTTSITNIQNIAATPAQRAEMEQMRAYDVPQFERGGIVSGPDSGYMVKLHGNEMVIPLDNNYTQGQPSAVDGKVRPKPKPIQKYETGTRSSAVGGRLGFGITNTMGTANVGTAPVSGMTQSLVDAMSLPMIATGGTVLAATTQLMRSMGSEGQNINPEIERISRPIADVFGLPPTITKAAKAKPSGTKIDSIEEATDSESKKGILAKLIDGFGSLLENLGDKINKTEEDKNDKPDGKGVSTDVSSAVTDPNVKAFLDVLAKPESGGRYDVSVGGKTFTDMSKHPEMYNPELNSDAAGRYQFLSTTYKPIAERLGLKDFSERSQDLAAVQYLKDLGVLDEIQSGDPKKIADVKRRLQKSTWTGLRKYTDEGAVKYFEQRKEYYSSKTTTSNNNATKINAQTSNVQLGQQITNNYGLRVGEERSFTHPQYGIIKAHKTEKGFDFYQGITKLDMSSSKPQSKSIVSYFESSNGGRTPLTAAPKQEKATFTPPQKPSIDQQLSSNVNSKASSSPNIIAMGLPQSNPKNGTTPMPSAKDSVLAPGYAPQLRDYYPTNTIT